MKKYLFLSIILLAFTTHSQEPIKDNNNNKTSITLENRLNIDFEPMLLRIKNGKMVLVKSPKKLSPKKKALKNLMAYLEQAKYEWEKFKKMLRTKDF
jgi:hypothetical protein